MPMNQATNQQLTIPQAMQLAEQHQASGNLQEAEQLLRQILQVQPEHAPALHLLGVIAHQAGNIELATQLIAQAIAIQPDTALFHSNLCEMYRQLNKLDDALILGKKAVKLDIGNASAHSNLGIVWYDKGELDKAEACQKKALEINPSLIAALNNLGSIYRDKKDLSVAEKYYRKVLSIAPHHLESMNNLGAVLTEKECPEQAVSLIQQALNMNPDYADAHHNIAIAQLMLEQEDKAEESFNCELQLQPHKASPYLGLGQLFLSKKQLVEAESMANKALEINPDDAKTYCLLGDIHTQSGFPEQAEADYAQALNLDSDLEGAYLGLGHLQMEQGNMDAAKTSFLHALKINPESIGAKLSLVQVGKIKKGDEHMASLIEEAKDLDKMLETKALSLHFALGKCFDDIKQYDEAFPHFLKGNQLRRKRLSYSADAHSQYVDRIQSFFSLENIKNLRSDACSSDVPIFVLGMPRSGTTLTEQIIASHPDVHGAGELPDLLDMANNPRNMGHMEYPNGLSNITQVELKLLGKRYVKGLKARSPQSKHITDKMPANFLCLGLIHLMLPQAKIIHVRRNPIDTCLSNFTKLFGHKSQPQSYDLAEMGRYYHDYARLMEHWRKVLPHDAFYEVQYETLVVNKEEETRKLIAYCGLTWNDACLSSHKTERIVRTASISQVRQPIYTSSVKRWKKYEAHLIPLLDTLEDLID